MHPGLVSLAWRDHVFGIESDVTSIRWIKFSLDFLLAWMISLALHPKRAVTALEFGEAIR
jgi:hypothetical protein